MEVDVTFTFVLKIIHDSKLSGDEGDPQGGHRQGGALGCKFEKRCNVRRRCFPVARPRQAPRVWIDLGTHGLIENNKKSNNAG